ncbi:hypothetical protein HN803_03650 [candidate division WWE3 bacterium]|nr:hypothetical protein [candidate division WWE3 bacterium]
MKIIGLYGCVGWSPEDAWLHSAGASLWIDGKHISTISEERLSREKYDGSFPNLSIDYVLEDCDLVRDDIDIVTYTQNVHSPTRLDNIQTILKREFPNSEVRFVDHHQAHACATFFTSPFERASILSFDGSGNSYPVCSDAVGFETGLYAIGDKTDGLCVMYHSINGLKKEMTFNLGQVYNNISRWCYTQMEQEAATKIDNMYVFMETAPGKIMGLAAYGDKTKVDLPNLFGVNDDRFYFPYVYDKHMPSDKEMGKYDAEDIAAWCQGQFEDTVVEFFKILNHKEKYLCIGGGCGLNVLTNARLLNEGLFEDIHVFPAANDSGLCFGGAIYEVFKEEKELIVPDYLGFLGREYDEKDIREALK